MIESDSQFMIIDFFKSKINLAWKSEETPLGNSITNRRTGVALLNFAVCDVGGPRDPALSNS